PCREGQPSLAGNAAAQRVEVVPPQAHADREPDDYGRNRGRVTFHYIADAADDTDDHFAEHDDREQPDSLHERCGDPLPESFGAIPGDQEEPAYCPADDNHSPQ